MTDGPKVTIHELQEVDMGDAQEISLDQLAGRSPLPNGHHGWVIGVVHAIEDPEVALDSMVMDVKTMIGFTDIYCLFCQTPYEARIRDQRCP